MTDLTGADRRQQTMRLHLAKPITQRINDDWLEFARHMIKCVEVARDISAEEATAAMNAPWPRNWPPLPRIR